MEFVDEKSTILGIYKNKNKIKEEGEEEEVAIKNNYR
jgi:hypothetical protein